MEDEIVVVRTYGTEVEAQIAQAALAADGIPSIVLPDNAGGMLPMLQVLFPVRLAVRREDAESARAVLDAPPGSHEESGGLEERHSWENDGE